MATYTVALVAYRRSVCLGRVFPWTLWTCTTLDTHVALKRALGSDGDFADYLRGFEQVSAGRRHEASVNGPKDTSVTRPLWYHLSILSLAADVQLNETRDDRTLSVSHSAKSVSPCGKVHRSTIWRKVAATYFTFCRQRLPQFRF